MNTTFFTGLLAVIGISAVSLVGLVLKIVPIKQLNRVVMVLVSFAAGSLFGDVFIHLLPEVVGDASLQISNSLLILFGIVFSLVMEKVIHWRHCHLSFDESHKHSFVFMNLFGDGIHNFIDGVILGASFLLSPQAGIATATAIALHELPQELSDIAVLLHSGYSLSRALLMNILLALSAVVGYLFAYWISNFDQTQTISSIVLPIAIGNFLYIAGSDLVPELHKESGLKMSLLQIFAFCIGIVVMMGLLLLD